MVVSGMVARDAIEIPKAEKSFGLQKFKGTKNATFSKIGH
jgi:hypothetical protein